MSDSSPSQSRRNALRCLAYGGARTLFTLAGGILVPSDLAVAAPAADGPAAGKPLFLQISDTHIGFAKDANPDVDGTLRQTIDLVNAMAEQPALVIHTGDITHLSKAAEFDHAQQLFSRLRVTEMHTVPGEHDTLDAGAGEYFGRFGRASNNKGYYSFDHAGVHFVALVNVLDFKDGGLGTLGAEQIAWIAADLKARTASTPIVVFAHMPLWTVHEPWGWGTGDADQVLAMLRRFRHHPERPHPPDRAEGRGQRDLSHRALHGLSAARRRRRRRPRPAQGARRAAAPDARRDHGQPGVAARAADADRHDHRLVEDNTETS